MNIQKIGNYNNNQSFKANLFYKRKDIKAGIFDTVDIAKCGAKSTDIFVSGIDVKDHGYYFNNRINFTLKSPIFGERTFNSRGRETTYNPSDEMQSREFIYNNFASKGDPCKYFENLTLEKTLLNKINENAYNNRYNYNSACETDAVKILDDILSKVDVEQEGLSDRRIKELYDIARDVNTDIAIQGTSNLLDKMA
jgi:hypothetical protein